MTTSHVARPTTEPSHSPSPLLTSRLLNLCKRLTSHRHHEIAPAWPGPRKSCRKKGSENMQRDRHGATLSYIRYTSTQTGARWAVRSSGKHEMIPPEDGNSKAALGHDCPATMLDLDILIVGFWARAHTPPLLRRSPPRSLPPLTPRMTIRGLPCRVGFARLKGSVAFFAHR